MARGSSPRVRGKLMTSYGTFIARGLIPACAGKTEIVLTKRLCAWAHPRVCGENGIIHEAATVPLGSSPRVRGKRGTFPSAIESAGLIPACAGKTLNDLEF